MKSVRLGPELEWQLREAARLLGVSESEIVRGAVSGRCAEILGQTLDRRLRDYVGALALGGGLAQATGRRFAELLAERGRTKGAR